MKKLIATLFCVLMLTALLCGCAADVGQPSGEGTGVTQPSGVTDPAVPSDSTLPDDTQTVEPTQPVAAFDAEGCTAALDAIAAHQPGSAGSSLKCFIASVAVLDWTENLTGSEGADITAAATEWFSGKSTDELTQFTLNLDDVDACVRDICAGNINVTDMSDSSGAQPAHETYTLEKYEVFRAAIDQFTAAA